MGREVTTILLIRYARLLCYYYSLHFGLLVKSRKHFMGSTKSENVRRAIKYLILILQLLLYYSFKALLL